MSVALLLIGDGRHDYRERTLESLAANVDMAAFAATVEIDDSDHRLGFAGAVQAGWSEVLPTGCDYCLHLELDFTFNRPLPLSDMVDVLAARPRLVQMALLRQPWNEQERTAGGIVQMHPGDYQPVHAGGHRWLEHRRHVTTNPALWPRRILERGWPQAPESEGHFGIDLFASDAGLRAAYWGEGEGWVTHIGDERAGHGY